MPRGRARASILSVGLAAPVIFGTFLIASGVIWAFIGAIVHAVAGTAPDWVYYAWPISDAAIALAATVLWVSSEGIRGPRAWLLGLGIWLWAVVPFAVGLALFLANPGK
jgi:hypothetical protein